MIALISISALPASTVTFSKTDSVRPVAIYLISAGLVPARDVLPALVELVSMVACATSAPASPLTVLIAIEVAVPLVRLGQLFLQANA